VTRRGAAAALAALLAVVAAVPAAAATSSGRWAIATRGDDAARVQLRLEYAESADGSTFASSWSSDVPIGEAGIPAARLRAPVGPVSFDIVREPGTFACTGSAGNGSGAGLFSYVPNPRFDDALASRGLGRPTYRQSLQLGIAGTTLAFVDALRSSSPHVTAVDVVRAVEHGVTVRYVDELGALGARNVPVDTLVRMRDHGVTPEMMRALQRAGYRLSPEELVRLVDHGVSERYIVALRDAGYAHVTADELLQLRDHGVDGAFVARLRAHGYTNVPVKDLIRLRDAGI
jgi:hypothetical protein